MRCGAERGAVIHTRQPEAVDAACRVDLVHEERLTRGLERLDLCHVAGAAGVTRGGRLVFVGEGEERCGGGAVHEVVVGRVQVVDERVELSHRLAGQIDLPCGGGKRGRRRRRERGRAAAGTG